MKEGISKSQSKMLQGLAILMMLYHHLFSTPEALGIPYYSLLNFNGINIEQKMAWFFKICVGIYAFVSGYGLYRALKGIRLKNGAVSFKECIILDYKCVLKKLISFYLNYWLVFIIFVPIGFIFFDKTFVFKEFILNFLGIISTYNGAWWYILFYSKMLLLLPLADCFFISFKDKNSKIIKIIFYLVLCFLTAGTYFFNKAFFSEALASFMPAFALCFFVGFILSRLEIFELCYRYIPEKLLYILGILGFLLVIGLRVHMAKDASSAGLDFIFVPVFAFGFLILLNLVPRISPIFSFFGKYSMFIWLIHVFFYDHYAKNVVMASHLSLGIYLTLLGLSTIFAILLFKVSALVRTKADFIFKKLKI